jgi:hypothetical protein
VHVQISQQCTANIQELVYGPPLSAAGATTSIRPRISWQVRPVVGAYIWAGELATHAPDHNAAFAAYERESATMSKRSRTFAVSAAKMVVPAGPLDLWILYPCT